MDHTVTLEHDPGTSRTTVTMHGRQTTTCEPEGMAGVLATAVLLLRVGCTVTVRRAQ